MTADSWLPPWGDRMPDCHYCQLLGRRCPDHPDQDQ